MSVRAVFFDVGETLVDETAFWTAWADWLGIPRLTFFAVLGAVIERGEDHRRVFEILAPDFTPERELEARAGGAHHRLAKEDLYPDALRCVERLKGEGYIVAAAGNHVAEIAERLPRYLPLHIVSSSEQLGVEKPSAEFFVRLASLAGLEPSQAAYVGDRLDNDVLPAKRAGMVAVFIRRGPWGCLHAMRPEVDLADIRIESLDELPALVSRL